MLTEGVMQDTGFPLDTNVHMINKVSNRKLYAKIGKNWQAGIGAGFPPSAVHDDGVWRIMQEDDGFRIINQCSQRSLYAAKAKKRERRCGAGSPPSAVHADGVWYITKEMDGFRITNKHSQRALYAAQGENWDTNVGAVFPPSAVHADGVWHIAVTQEQPSACPELRMAHFPMLSESESADISIAYGTGSEFTSRLRDILEDHGVAIVTGVLSQDECVELEQIWFRELVAPTPQPRQHCTLNAQGELAWRARLHPKVKLVFASIFGAHPDTLATGTDKLFYSEKGVLPRHTDLQWLHVDQNHSSGLTHLCYQGVLYVWSSGEQASTTAVWPGSHKPDIYHRIIASEPKGQFVMLRDLEDRPLERMAISNTRRLSVPSGALLLWDSRTVHQGWRGGPRLAVPVCWEPRERVGAEATSRKLYYAAAGVPTSHSPSEGRLHPNITEIFTPCVRPFSVLPGNDSEWRNIWQGGKPSDDVLLRILRPEVASSL